MTWQQVNKNLAAAKLQGKILVQESMSKHTTWKIGGPADMMIIANNFQDVVEVLNEADKFNIPITVLGNGSNLLVRDGGIRGIVVKISSCLSKVAIDEDLVEAEVGISLPKLARLAAENSLTGLEFGSGIPATLGGAIIMNAGIVGGEIGTVVEKIMYADRQGNIYYAGKEKLHFSYRHAVFPATEIILLKAWLRLDVGDKEVINQQMQEQLAKRKKSQPLSMPNAGSVFKNPGKNFAGKLIEATGLKGTKIGGAQVSEKHANFIVNLGNASANDVLELVQLISTKVVEETGVQLELEVKVLGDDLTS